MTTQDVVWPEDVIPAASVNNWIAAGLHLPTQPDGPLVTLASDSTSVAAIFTIDQDNAWFETQTASWMSEPMKEPNAANALFFNACLIPELANSPEIYAFLMARAPQHVPHLLASTQVGDQTWMLFTFMKAPTVEQLESYNRLVQAAGVLADVQIAVTEHPIDDGTGIDIIAVPDLIQGYDQVRQFAAHVHDAETVQMLDEFRPDFMAWVQEPGIPSVAPLNHARRPSYEEHPCSLQWRYCPGRLGRLQPILPVSNAGDADRSGELVPGCFRTGSVGRGAVYGSLAAGAVLRVSR